MWRRSLHRLARAPLLWFAVLCAWTEPLRAQELAELFDFRGGVVRFEADRMRADTKRDRIVASGHVRLRRGKALLTADEVVIDRGAGVAFARGRVVVRAGVRVLQAPRLDVDLRSMVAVLQEAELLVKEGVAPEVLEKLGVGRALFRAGRNAMRLRARRIVKGPGPAFHLEDASLTPCDCGDDPPSWQITAPRMEVDPADGAFVDRPTFRIGEDGVLGFPAAWVPFGDRRTGLLQPQVAYTGLNGWLGQGSFFWAPTRSFDATFVGEYLQARGFRPGAEVRFATGERSDGRLAGAWIDDTATGSHRFNVDGFVRQALGAHGRLVLDLALVSDAQYISAFSYALRDRSAEYLTSTLGIEWAHGDHAASVAADWYQDLQGGLAPIDLFSNQARDTVHRLPRARYELLPRPIEGTPVYVGLRAGFAHFYRTGDALGDADADGTLSGTDPARIYKRLDIAASAAAPIALGPVTFTPRLTYRQLAYDAALPGFPATRGHLLVGADLAAPFSRVFGAGDAQQPSAEAPVGAVRHVLEPIAMWRYVPATFERGEGAARVGTGFGLDDLDNLYGAHRLYAGVRTRLTRKNGPSTWDTFFSARLTQGFDLGAAHVADLRLRAELRLGLFETKLELSYDPALAQLDESLVSASIRDTRGDSLTLTHNYLRAGRHERFDLEDVESPLFRGARARQNLFGGIHELTVSPTVRVPGVPLTLSWLLQYSFTLRDILQSTYSLRYESTCKCWGISASVAQILGIGQPVVGFFLSLTALGSGGAPVPVF